jgi:microcystin-dependent protein
MYFKAGDSAKIVLQFGRSSDPTSSESFFQSPTWTAENLSGGSNIKLGIKQSGVYADGELLAGSATFTHDAIAKTYTFDLSLNTEQIDTALFRMDETAGNDVGSLACQFEVTYQPSGSGGWRSSVLPVAVTIYHDILSGVEDSPTNAEDPTAYALKSEIINVPEDATVVGNIVLFDSTDGKEVIDSGVAIAGLAPALGADDNYVTDAEKTVIGNTSGTNTGDNAVNSLYSGLVTNATHTGDVTGATALTIADGAVTEAKCNSSINASLDLADSSIQPGNAALTDARTPTAHASSHVTGGSDKLRDATASQDGLMTGAYAAKLDGIATSANNYIHPNHSGDVTSAGDGATTIANDAVTFAKMQTISSEKLMGRHGGGSGNAQEVSVGNGIEFHGSGIRRAALTGDVTATAGSNTTAIANGVVTEAKCNSSINASLDLADSSIQPGNPALTDARTPTAHTHEGTAILSTGEAGGTKFLREDGDGTCSWQALAGGGDALTSNPLSQFAATTSLQLKNTISDESGSGALVFANTPTLVSPLLGTPTSGVLTNCTGLPTAGLVDDAVTLDKMASGSTGELISYDDSGNPVTVGAGAAGAVLTSQGGADPPTFQTILPAGLVSPYAGTAAPTGWLLCAGQTVSRTTYADLFSALSTTYGAGDGSTTFALPDLRGRVPAGKDDMGGSAASRLTSASAGLGTSAAVLGAVGGAESHTLLTAEMPAHTHTQNYRATSANATAGSAVRPATGLTSDDTGSTGGGGAHKNVQPTIILNYIIKT